MEEVMDHVDEFTGERIRSLTLSRFGESRVMEQYNRLFLRLTDE